MAIAINQPSVIKNVIKFDDTYTDTLSVTYSMDPAATSIALAAFYTALDAACEAKIDSINWVEDNLITGQKAAAVNALQNLVSVQAVLTFDGTVANSKGVYPVFSIKLPSPAASCFTAQGIINPTDANVAAVIAFAQSSMMYEIGNVIGTKVPTWGKGAIYNQSKSGFITLPREIK